METEKSSRDRLNVHDQHSLPQSIMLHLLPGLLILLFYIVTAPLAQKMGFPSLMALFLGVGVILIPFELGYLLYQARKHHGTYSFKEIVPFVQPLRWWQYPVFVVLLLGWSGLCFAVFAATIDRLFIDAFFRWIPDWFFLTGSTNDLSVYAKSALVATAVLNVILNGVAAPVVEELYFRGYLLPRLSRLKGWAPLVNVLLFSLYHFFTPWQNLTRILALSPMVYSVWWKRNVFLGLIVHCAGNLIGAIGMLVMALSIP